jgi:hypothetical protein
MAGISVGPHYEVPSSGPVSAWANDRFLYLCWKGSPHEWLLSEDTLTTEQSRADAMSQSEDLERVRFL